MENNRLENADNIVNGSDIFEVLSQFHSGKEEKQCRIIDLCTEDKKRIVHLIEELTKCNEQKKELEGKISVLLNMQKKQEKQFEKLLNSKIETQKEMQMKIDSLKAEMHTSSTEMLNMQNAFNQQVNMLEEEVQKLNSSLERVLEDNRKLELSVSQYENKLKKCNSIIKRQEEELNTVKEDDKKTESQIETDVMKPKVSSIASQTSVEFRNEESEKRKELNCAGNLICNATEHILLSELFFTKPNIPPEFECLFFLPPRQENYIMEQS